MLVVISLLSVIATGTSALGSEDWKGPADPADIRLGALAGLTIIDSSAGFGLIGTASKRIAPDGFVPGITNPVSIEAEVGPSWNASQTLFWYSAQLRWDFQKDDTWTIYALGGFGGNIVNSRFEFYPRFGVGAFYKINSMISLRGEASHELTAVGVSFPF